MNVLGYVHLHGFTAGIYDRMIKLNGLLRQLLQGILRQWISIDRFAFMNHILTVHTNIGIDTELLPRLFKMIGSAPCRYSDDVPGIL